MTMQIFLTTDSNRRAFALLMFRIMLVIFLQTFHQTGGDLKCVEGKKSSNFIITMLCTPIHDRKIKTGAVRNTYHVCWHFTRAKKCSVAAASQLPHRNPHSDPPKKRVISPLAPSVDLQHFKHRLYKDGSKIPILTSFTTLSADRPPNWELNKQLFFVICNMNKLFRVLMFHNTSPTSNLSLFLSHSCMWFFGSLGKAELFPPLLYSFWLFMLCV